jgi:hypothetical protein
MTRKEEIKKQIADLTKKLEDSAIEEDVVEEDVLEDEQTLDEVLSDEEDGNISGINPEDIVTLIMVGTDKNGQLFFKISGQDNIIVLDGLLKYANLLVEKRWKKIEEEISKG